MLAVVGSGAAEKFRWPMIRTLLALTERPGADAADALAVAVCHAHAAPWPCSPRASPRACRDGER